MKAFRLDPENRVFSLLRSEQTSKNTLHFVLPLAMLLVLLVECIPSTITDTPVDVVDVGLTGSGPGCCVVVNNARYLMNSGGFHVGHWGFVVAGLFSKMNALRPPPNACRVILRDATASRRRMRKVKEAAKRSDYLRASMRMFESMTGVSLNLLSSSSTFSCSEAWLIRTDAGVAPDEWIDFSSYRFPELAANDSFGCSDETTDDILIYNRRGSRNIRNDVNITDFFRSYGLKAAVRFPDQLSPAEQICEMVKRRKMIITPHGGQQGSLIFKRSGVAVVVVSPEEALLECYRFFAREHDLWYHIRGSFSWACEGPCSKSVNAWRSDGCNHACAVKARHGTIDMSLSALEEVLRESIIFDEQQAMIRR